MALLEDGYLKLSTHLRLFPEDFSKTKQNKRRNRTCVGNHYSKQTQIT